MIFGWINLRIKVNESIPLHMKTFENNILIQRTRENFKSALPFQTNILFLKLL